jgi:hypothetical protein
MEIQFDDGYLFKIIDDKNAWFPRMEVLDTIYHPCFFTANSLGDDLPHRNSFIL